jgi:NitT/TauT family transport system permease protein
MLNMKKILNIRYAVVSMILLLAVWEIAFLLSDYSSALFPSPLMAFKALGEMVVSGQLWESILTSMRRFLIGYGLSVLAAVLLGLLLGCFGEIFKYINPLLQVLRPISPTAWMPFVVLLVGIGDLPAIVIIFIAAFFPVLLTTASAVGKIDPIYFRVSRNFGIRQPALLWKVILPAIFPSIANAMHVSLGSAWIFLVAGEMVGAQSGLGYQIIDARNNVRADYLLATILVIGLIGLFLDFVIGRVEKRINKAWGGE